MKWRAVFGVESYIDLGPMWYRANKTITRVIEKDSHDHAVIYANAMVGECTYQCLRCSERLGHLMFIEVAPEDADLNENCKDLKASQERAERIFNERSGRDA